MSNWAAYVTNQVPPITTAEQQQNVLNLATYFRSKGWTDNAIAAMCGNMQTESYLNPGQYQHGYPVGTASGGFGLVQWTPRTKFSDWAGAAWESDFDLQPARIQYELENGLQWQYRPGYTQYISFADFAVSTASVDYLTGAWLYYYEGPADPASSITVRRQQADNWYTFLGNTPTPSLNIPIWMLFKIRWKRRGQV